MNLPEFNSEFICIVDRKKPVLASVISSYLHKEGSYLSVFAFGLASTNKSDSPANGIDEHYITRTRCEALNIKIRNSIKKLGGCKYLILGGLSENQKSYLTFLDEFNCIEIETLSDTELYLSGIVGDKINTLLVRPNEAQYGLFIAAKSNSILKVDDAAESLTESEEKLKGLILVENIDSTSTVIAVNYALSINASIKIVEPLEEYEPKEIRDHIESWQKGSSTSLVELQAIMYRRIEGVEFSIYDFATFFTVGVPYSLILENIIPFTYVNLHLAPDFFIFDNIYIEKQEIIGSSIVFSPLEFGDDEETEFVTKSLRKQNLYVQELIGENASVFNIDMHVKEYPYDLLHICSHGGEVSGFSLRKEFVDSDGNKHTIEFDEVISFAPKKGEDLISVETKQIWRKFDGFLWKSKELKAQNHPHYVFSDMINELQKQTKEKYDRTPKMIVPDSCAIKCHDFNYQAMFNMVACFHTSPIIFNNTCWSWSGISDSFLAGGARGYIGTLWDIENIIAKKASESFYNYLFEGTVLNALQEAFEETIGTKCENIYVFWGLHFATMKKGKSIEQSRINITHLLLQSFYRWTNQAEKVSNDEISENIQRLADWDIKQLEENFSIETNEIFKDKNR
ncbi:MAG: hypothetical protein KAT48_08620 [Bacteroidales bacterium]|nr:hypothetical protein [Bacteroidales bacterium]